MKSLSSQLASLSNEMEAEAKAKASFQAFKESQKAKLSKEDIASLFSQREDEKSYKGSKGSDRAILKANGF